MTPEENSQKRLVKVEGIKLVWGAFGDGDKCTGVVEKIYYDEPFGVFTKYMGCNYLFNGFPDGVKVQAISVPKKMIAGLFPFMDSRFFQFLVVIALGIFSVLPKKSKGKIVNLIVSYYLNVGWAGIKTHALKDNKFCVSGREIMRTIGVIFPDSSPDYIFSNVKLGKRIIGMQWEYDYAYRGRGQDVLPKLDKKKLAENPRKEILRIIDILIERDSSCLIKWKRAKKLLRIVLLNKTIRDYVKRFFLELDLDKIKMTDADWYYVLDRSDYKYGGMTHAERMAVKAIIDKREGNRLPDIIFKSKNELPKDIQKSEELLKNELNQNEAN